MQPIGIFDSGIGGLTVASAIRKELPGLDLIYYGDTAHMPYGDKSPETIRKYADSIVDFLYQNHCRTIVIACNTASAMATESLNQKWGKEIQFVNVIDPVVEYLKEQGSYQNIGIIGTKGTIQSGVYTDKLIKALPNSRIHPLATPLLAALIEEGYFNNTISTAIIKDYLEMEPLKGIDCLILACTHYPLIKRQIAQILGDPVYILDSSELIAQYLHAMLKVDKRLINNELEKKEGKSEFYVSDFTESFQKSTELFFGNRIDLKKIS